MRKACIGSEVRVETDAPMSNYKPDMEATKSRWDDFWHGRNTRPMLCATVRRPGVKEVAKPPYAAGYDGNFAPVMDQLAGWAESHEFLGEAIPFFYLEFAANHFSTFLGADLTFIDEGGGWPVQFVKDWQATELSFQRQGKWWRRTVEFAQAIKQRFGDNLMIASPTLVANMDALASVRGENDLLLDMVDSPELIQRALKQVLQAHGEILDTLADLLEYKRLGSINRHGLYCRGRINVPQCDFSCMLSGEMFREFVLPSLKVEMSRFDQVEYHLDGPDATRHVEDLCGIDKLDVIQWVAGAGNDQKDWTWLYDKIARLGKGHFCWSDAAGALRMAKKYRPRKLVYLLGVGSKAEFDECAGRLAELWQEPAA